MTDVNQVHYVCVAGACNNLAGIVVDGWRLCAGHGRLYPLGSEPIKPRAQRVQPTIACAMDAATTVFDGNKPATPSTWQGEMDALRSRLAAVTADRRALLARVQALETCVTAVCDEASRVLNGGAK